MDLSANFDTSLQKKEQHAPYHWSTSWNCQNRAHPRFFDVRYREGKGIGYSKGYGSSDLFLSYTTERYFTPFLDLRGHYFDDHKWAANGGLGFRDLSESLNLVFGINLFYDYREAKRTNFHQLGLGIEILGERWDFRANGYIPLGERRKTLSSTAVLVNGETFLQKKVEYDFIGGDVELGRVVLKWAGLQAKLTGGAYYLHGLFGKQVIGGLLRLSGFLSPYIGFELQGSYDPKFTWIGQGQLSLVLPFGRRLFDLKKAGCPKWSFHPQERFLEPVSRFEIIPIDKHKTRRAL